MAMQVFLIGLGIYDVYQGDVGFGLSMVLFNGFFLAMNANTVKNWLD